MSMILICLKNTKHCIFNICIVCVKNSGDDFSCAKKYLSEVWKLRQQMATIKPSVCVIIINGKYLGNLKNLNIFSEYHIINM